MAKKKETLTIEQKLQNAIIPEWAHPYKVPKNWVWTRLGDVFVWGSGGTPSRTNPKYYDGNIPWVKTGDLNDGYIYVTEEKITDEAIKNSSAKLYPKDTIIIAMYGATIGKIGILTDVSATNQACGCAIPNNVTDAKFLYYYALSQRTAFIELGKGGAQPNISQQVIKDHQFPFPPLNEQNRIVERIETLFEKLDRAKELIQLELDKFKDRKSVILHQAFSGELTNNWRQANGVSIEKWERVPLIGCLFPVKDKFDPAMDNSIFKYIGLEHIGNSSGIIAHGFSSNLKSTKTKFIKGDILYGKLRPNLNKHDIVSFDGVCSTDILVYRAKNIESAKFINYYMDTNQFIEYAVSNSKGINLPRVSEKDISKYVLDLPSIDEQKEIVRILDSILEKEDNIKDLIDILDKIEETKKTILSKAFHGDLGTNNTSDESAYELLRQCVSADKEVDYKPLRKKNKISDDALKRINNDIQLKVYKYILEKGDSLIADLVKLRKDPFEVMDAVRSLENNGVIVKENNVCKIIGD